MVSQRPVRAQAGLGHRRAFRTAVGKACNLTEGGGCAMAELGLCPAPSLGLCTAAARASAWLLPQTLHGCGSGPLHGCSPRPLHSCCPRTLHGCSSGPLHGCCPGPLHCIRESLLSLESWKAHLASVSNAESPVPKSCSQFGTVWLDTACICLRRLCLALGLTVGCGLGLCDCLPSRSCYRLLFWVLLEDPSCRQSPRVMPVQPPPHCKETGSCSRSHQGSSGFQTAHIAF